MIADKQLTRMIEKGKPLSVIRKKVEALASAEDRADWHRAMQDEYDTLYPTKRQATEEELRERYEEFKTEVDNEVGINPLDTYEKWVELAPDWTEIPESEQPVGYMQFTDWLNETRVITEAVEATYDEDGMVLTEAVAEVTELVRPYVAKDVADIVDAYVNNKYKELRAKEYPPIADYVDAVVKDDTEAIEAYKEACLAVKAKYPKVMN